MMQKFYLFEIENTLACLGAWVAADTPHVFLTRTCWFVHLLQLGILTSFDPGALTTNLEIK